MLVATWMLAVLHNFVQNSHEWQQQQPIYKTTREQQTTRLKRASDYTTASDYKRTSDHKRTSDAHSPMVRRHPEWMRPGFVNYSELKAALLRVLGGAPTFGELFGCGGNSGGTFSELFFGCRMSSQLFVNYV